MEVIEDRLDAPRAVLRLGFNRRASSPVIIRSWAASESGVQPTGDARFDRLFRVSGDLPGGLALLSDPIRARLLELGGVEGARVEVTVLEAGRLVFTGAPLEDEARRWVRERAGALCRAIEALRPSRVPKALEAIAGSTEDPLVARQFLRALLHYFPDSEAGQRAAQQGLLGDPALRLEAAIQLGVEGSFHLRRLIADPGVPAGVKKRALAELARHLDQDAVRKLLTGRWETHGSELRLELFRCVFHGRANADSARETIAAAGALPAEEQRQIILRARGVPGAGARRVLWAILNAAGSLREEAAECLTELAETEDLERLARLQERDPAVRRAIEQGLARRHGSSKKPLVGALSLAGPGGGELSPIVGRPGGLSTSDDPER